MDPRALRLGEIFVAIFVYCQVNPRALQLGEIFVVFLVFCQAIIERTGLWIWCGLLALLPGDLRALWLGEPQRALCGVGCGRTTSLTMATTSSGTNTGGVPLEEYRREIPPGWDPSMAASYPLKTYLERVKVWYRLWDGPDESVGPLLAGRLRGRAQAIAMNLRLPTPHGGMDIGDAALIRLPVDRVEDPATGEVIQHPIPSGAQALLSALRAAFGEAEQLLATKALETFFEFRRGRLTLPEWSVQWQLNYEEAVTHAGLDINQVAKTYLFCKSSGLGQKAIDDLLLQVHGDMRRFEEFRTLLLRMAHRSDNHSNLYSDETHSTQFYIDEDCESSWSGISDSWQDGSWDEVYYNDELYAWYGDYENYWDYSDGVSEDWQDSGWQESGWNDDGEVPEPDQSEDNHNDAETQEYFKGKGKGHGGRSPLMGLGCRTCGSKWHNTHSCPLGDRQPGFNNKGKSFGKSKGSGYGKGKGKSKFPRKGYGKSKGFGKKGKPWKGSGKRTLWSDTATTGYADYYGGAYLVNYQDKPMPSLVETPQKPMDFQAYETPKNLAPIITMESPDREEMLNSKKVRFEDADPAEGEPSTSSTTTAKKLNFPEWTLENTDNFHTVRGRRVCGLLVDPGASSGLVGTDTLKELMESGMIPHGREGEVSWGPSTTTVTGISRQSDDTLAKVSLPFGVGEGVTASYTADLIGGAGSTCPALLPNPSLRQMRSIVLTQWYDNGDGVMVCCTSGHRPDHPDAVLVVMKLLLAESGHYILPVNKEDQQMTDQEMAEVLKIWKRPCQATTLEQTQSTASASTSATTTSHGDTSQPSLQFTAEIKEPQESSAHMDKLEKNSTSSTVPQQDLRQVAEDEQPIQVLLGEIYDEEYQEGETEYGGDVFPGHLPEHRLRYLQKMYRAVPEEFYTKSKRTPVTPRNARSWMRKRKTTRFHFWEWCSGSGRLSLLALLSGLCVLFPLDYRYGWDLAHPEHQRLINELEMDMGNNEPEVLLASPSCRPWSIASSKRDLNKTQMERDAEMPTVDFMKKKVRQRAKRKKGNIFEQPWSSALWEHLQDVPGDLHRTDQCRFQATDELGNPILKPTGLKADIMLKHAVARCKGHLGKKHGWLQGSVQGMNRTTMAAVYPTGMRRALIKDIKRFINYKSHFVESYYKCERCSMGRAALDSMEHSFIPGECRYGKWPEGDDPRDKRKMIKEQQDRDNIMEKFKKEALQNEKVMHGKLAAHPDIAFDSEQTAILKMCLVRLLAESINKFEELEKKKGHHDYVHWLEDSVAMSWMKRTLKEYLDVHGVLACLQPWSKPTPAPMLSPEQSPLRLLLYGNLTSWRIAQLEDLREMSASQWHEPLNIEDDWMVAVFGGDPGELPTASASSGPRKPMVQRLQDLDEESDGYEPSIAPEGVLQEPMDMEEEPQEARAVNPASLKPVYDFKRIFKRLPLLAERGDIVMVKRLLLGLHERLWHASLRDVSNVLQRCGMPHGVWRHAADAIASCVVCRKHSRAGRRPQNKGAHLGTSFNDVVQVDLFRFGESWYLLIICEVTRYKVATKCEGRELSQVLGALMRSWIRYFGPMRTLISDQ